MGRLAVAIVALAFGAAAMPAMQATAADEPAGEPSTAPTGGAPADVRQPWWASDEAELLRMLEDAGLASEGTLEDALRELELPFAFAGREQWVRNLSGAGVEDEQRLWNVSMESIAEDENAFRLLLGRTLDVSAEHGPEAALDDLAYWRTLVPEWAPRVRDALAERGIPFSVELLASPEIEVHDAAKPLFGKGQNPDALVGLGVLQRGENAFLRSLSAEELMLEVWPLYWRYYHRPAGAPVPADLIAGLTFGAPVQEACTENTANGCINGLRYRRSAVMDTDLYKRWVAYGMPGSTGEGQHNGFVVDSFTGYGFNPTTGAFFQLGGGSASHQAMWLGLLQSGALRPEHFITPWNDVVSGLLGSRIAAAGFLRDPSIWFSGPNAPYAPDKLPPGTLDRFLVLVAGG